MQIQPVQPVDLQDLFSFGHLAHNIGHGFNKFAHNADKYGHEAYKDARIAGHYAGAAAPVIAALAGDKYGGYAAQAGQFADSLPPMQLQELNFNMGHWGHDLGKFAHNAEKHMSHDLGQFAHNAEKVGHEAYKDAKIAGHITGMASPIIGMVGGPEAGAAAVAIGEVADHLPLQNLQDADLQNLRFSWKKLGRGFNKFAHTAEHIGQEAYKDAKIAGKFAGQAAPVIAALAGDKYGNYAQTAAQYANAMPLQNLQQEADLQNLRFSWKKFGHGLNKFAHTAEHIGAEAYKDAKIAGKFAGQAAPVIAALAGDKYGNYAQTASQYANAMPLVNLQEQQPLNVYLI